MTSFENIPLISVIIPTYNRFSLLKTAIKSVLEQTYKNVEIIVVNDASTEKEYYNQKINGCNIIHLKQNSREIIGFPCAGYIRNIGAKIAKGDYLAFLDDDDIWLPTKLHLQLDALLKKNKDNNIYLSCTDGYIGFSAWHFLIPPPTEKTQLQLYNKEYYFNILCNIYNTSTEYDLKKNGFPNIWDYNMLKIHNCVITSSVLIPRTFFENLKGFNNLRNGEEDYDLWLRSTEKGAKIIYIEEPCFYYFLRN